MIKIFIQEFLLQKTDFCSFLETFLDNNSKVSSKSESLTDLSYDDFYLKGCYFKKIIQKEITNNPFLDKEFIEFEYFINQQFYLIKSNNRFFLVVVNPTKYTKNFYSYLDNLSGLNLILKDKNISIEKIIAEKLANTSHRVSRAKFTSVSLSESSKASIEITSSANAVDDFVKAFGNIYYTISKAKIIFSTPQHNEFDLDISKSGLIQISKFNSINEFDILNIISKIYL